MTHCVTIVPQGPTFDCLPNNTVLEAAEAAGLNLPYGCRNGSCGACRLSLQDGEVDYRGNAVALGHSERQAGLILSCQAIPRSDIALCSENTALAGLRYLPARVHSRELAAADVLILTLRLPQGETLDYQAGQYIDLIFPGDQRRSFSIANAQKQNPQQLELHLRLVSDGKFTPQAFADWSAGHLLNFEGPLGGFFYRNSGRDAVMIAGGTGLAPIKAILESLAAQTEKPAPIALYWGVRDEPDLYLHDWLLAFAAEHDWLRYTPVLSETHENWAGRRGWVHAAVAEDFPHMQALDVYMSGPPAMVQAGKQQFFRQGLPPGQLYYDAFDYSFVATGAAKG